MMEFLVNTLLPFIGSYDLLRNAVWYVLMKCVPIWYVFHPFFKRKNRVNEIMNAATFSHVRLLLLTNKINNLRNIKNTFISFSSKEDVCIRHNAWTDGVATLPPFILKYAFPRRTCIRLSVSIALHQGQIQSDSFLVRPHLIQDCNTFSGLSKVSYNLSILFLNRLKT